jgi:hypothetical protein
MASEVEYVNCQELRNPLFTPRVVFTESDVSLEDQTQEVGSTSILDIKSAMLPVILPPAIEVLIDPVSHFEMVKEEQSDISPVRPSSQLEATNGHYVEPTVSSVILAPPAEVCPSPVLHTENLLKGHSVAVLPASPAILVRPTEISQSHDSPSQTVPEEQFAGPQCGGEDGDSSPTVGAEQNAATLGPEPTQKPEEPSISDQDDDVQFILSVTRKRRKKRPRQDHLPGNQGQEASVLVGKNTPRETSNPISHGACPAPETGNMLSLALATPRKLAQSYAEIQHERGNCLPPSAALFPMVGRVPSLATLPTKAQKAMRKRKRDQDNISTVKPQIPGKVQRPSFHQRLQVSAELLSHKAAFDHAAYNWS